MIIEFLYKKIKYTIFILMLPSYICNQILFVTVALVNEQIRSNIVLEKEKNVVYGAGEMQKWSYVLLYCLVFNLIFVLVQTCLNLFMFQNMGLVYLKRKWTWVDLIVLVLSITILTYFFGFASNISDGTYISKYNYYVEQTTIIRIMLMFGQMLLFTKSQYFLSMIDHISPLISIAFQIMVDILGFLVILIIFMFSFSFAFFILAQNQLNFDNLSPEDVAEIPYATFIGSLQYIGTFIL